jgi:hypothetical protein
MSWREILVFGQVAFCLIGLGGSANALTVTDIVGPGSVNPLNADTEYDYTSPKILGGTTFKDIFYFTPNNLTGPDEGTVLASFLPPPAGSFTSLKLTWWKDNAPVGVAGSPPDVLLNTLSVLGPVETGPLLLALVAGANYYLEVDGTVASGRHKGTYTFSLTTTPLPPALVLFGSALAGLMLLGRRSRPSTLVALR